MNQIYPANVAYNKIADSYDTWYWQKFWHEYELPIMLEQIEKYSNVGRLLDVGCGTGTYLLEIGKHFPSIELWGIDTAENMILQAETKSKTSEVSMTLQHSSLSDACFNPGQFDLVMMNRVASHMSPEEVSSTFEIMSNLVSPNGILIISDVSYDHDYGHTRIPDMHGNKVYIETHKHSFESLEQQAAYAGLHQQNHYDLDNPEDGSPIGFIKVYKQKNKGRS